MLWVCLVPYLVSRARRPRTGPKSDGRALYGAGAKTLILATRALGEICPRAENPEQRCIPRKPGKTEAWASGVEVQAFVVDTRTAVWVSTPEKITLREAQKIS